MHLASGGWHGRASSRVQSQAWQPRFKPPVEAARQSRPEKDAALLSRLLVGCSCMRAMHQIEALAGVGTHGLAVHTSGGSGIYVLV